MKNKRPIDIQRESSFTLNIGEDEDTSAIQELFTTSNYLYVIKDNGIYVLQFADDIDPSRSNPNIPNLYKKVLHEGYNNEIVARILLTTKYLFDENKVPVEPFVSSVLEGSLELTRHVLELHKMSSILKDEIVSKQETLLRNKQNINAFKLPAITGLDTNLHNVIIKADKSKDAILFLYKLLLLPEEKSKPKLTKYSESIKNWPNIEQDYLSYWNEYEQFFTFIRNIRNCSEHPKSGHQIMLSDFRMNSNGMIDSPFVSIEHKDTPIGRVRLIEFLEFIQETVIDCAESSVVFMRCLFLLLNKNPFGEWVSFFEEKERRHPLVRFYRSVNFGGKEYILG